MKRRILPLLLGLLLLATLIPAAAATEERAPSPADSLSYDDFVKGHLSYPAKEQADRFMARQEQSGARPAAAAGYGRKGCKPEVTYEVGDERTFWVSQSQAGNIEITAVLAAKSPNGYMWVQREFYVPVGQGAPEGGFVTQAEAEKGLVDWETIYTTDRKYFGKEPSPAYRPENLAPGLPKDWRDADCDKRISILNFPIDAPGANQSTGYVAGYYSSEHEYPNGDGENESPFSNETEMFFMNSALLDVGDPTYAGVLAHEFYHMIQFSNDYNEETWVNEGMADIAAIVNGFGDIVEGHISAYSDDPDNHLFDWGSDVADYGQSVLFMDYLFNQYGEVDDPDTKEFEAYLALAPLLTRTPADGAQGITQVIRNRPDSLTRDLPSYFRKGSFGKVFKDYLVANYLDNSNAASGQYGYPNRDVQVAGAGSGATSPDGSTVFPYAGEYYDLGGELEGQMSIDIEDPVAVIPAAEGQPKPDNGFFAWSSRGDELLSWLERPADLTNAKAPTLDFKYWYQIEADWDYAYVRVSTDGGKTYEMQNTSACGGQSTDPNGNNRAIEESGGITGDSEGWQDCSLDLSAYAGKKVLIRYEYDTDQAVVEPGYVVDNVKLKDGDKAIWRTSKFERARSSRAWKYGGSGLIKWRRIQPLAKNKPLIQLLRIDGDKITRKVLKRKAFVPVEGGLRLKVPFTVLGDRTVAIFSSTTPIATSPFGYSYKVE